MRVKVFDLKETTREEIDRFKAGVPVVGVQEDDNMVIITYDGAPRHDEEEQCDVPPEMYLNNDATGEMRQKDERS